ncbi:GL20099 [Drosophila persimilis]|uniref:GL20099 n=2 Tax=pseudoobscura subgroup TaxID=32358 RepID=B4H8I5_DROPE|nr:lysM and putative peptidoglycan-binding domain-containing protein 3 [Drosophila pseudoobscura]XP_002027164.1 lysM and putative peptidoglycan-binding domain-containing protein 3 [Drosophila persimilis]XP_033247943.1 lysM and putative peptidoglycan-binding domain-containing protein 3-like [Drosophila miranda]EDW35020.1 GL20099 [Drosophila persimilis]
MRRNVRHQNYNWDDPDPDNVEDIFARPAYDDDEFVNLVPLGHRPNGHARLARYENTLEVNVQEGDTLQALALKFHCSVADIKRLNMIDRDNEIHAHRIIRIPVTVHNVLLGNGVQDALPAVHRSGNNSPRHNIEREPAIERNPLEDARQMLDERLLVAAVNASGSVDDDQPSTSKAASKYYEGAHGSPNDEANMERSPDDSAPLLNDLLVDRHAPLVRPIPGPSLRAIDWSGSDCDMSWICLLIFILALCVVIPLVYVVYLAEHPHHNHSSQ